MAIQQSKTPRIQIIARWLFLFFVGLSLVACGKDDAPQPSTDADQTVLIYMPGRSLYSRFYTRNVAGVEAAVTTHKGVPGNNRILVCWQPEQHGSATLFEVVYDKKTKSCLRQTVQEYDAFDASSPAQIREVFEQTARTAPAKQYGLIVGTHGSGWLDAGLSLTGDTTTELSTWSAPMPHPDALVTRAMGDTNHQIELCDFADVCTSLTYRFRYIIFDVCFMSNIESLYDLRHTCDYMVASPCEIMGAGFPYDRITPLLLAGGDTENNLKAVCEAFWNFYMYDWNTVSGNAQSGCLSLVKSAELDALAQVVGKIRHQYPPMRSDDLQIYDGMTLPLFFDLEQYLLSGQPSEALTGQLKEAMQRAFPETWHTPSFYSAANNMMNAINYYSGVATSEPSDRYKRLWQETSWGRVVAQ